MSKCKTPACKKEVVPGEEYCCACRDKHAAGFRNKVRVILPLLGVAIGVLWTWIKKGGSSEES